MKTIRYSIAALLLCTSLAASSQDVPPNDTPPGVKGYLAFSGGISLPQGSFNSNSGTMYPGGYATPGANFSVSLDMTPRHFPIGLAVMGGYYLNRYDYNSYLNNLQAADVNATYGTDQHNANRLYYAGFYEMAGLCKEVNLSTITFDFRVLAGAASVSTPEIYYFAIQQNTPVTTSERDWDISSSRGSAFAYNFGITARIRRAYGIDIFVSADYLGSRIPYSTSTLYTDPDGNLSSYRTNTNVNISLLTFSVGFGYDLGE